MLENLFGKGHHATYEHVLYDMRWCFLEVFFIIVTALGLSMPVMSNRKKHFSEEYLNQFKLESNKQIGQDPAKLGYPDMGSGRYSKKWDLATWIDFNKTQRVHLNTIESLPILVFTTLLAGFYDSKTSAIAGLIYLAGRIGYLFAYKYSPNLRSVGALPLGICLGIQTWTIYKGLTADSHSH